MTGLAGGGVRVLDADVDGGGKDCRFLLDDVVRGGR